MVIWVGVIWDVDVMGVLVFGLVGGVVLLLCVCVVCVCGVCVCVCVCVCVVVCLYKRS